MRPCNNLTNINMKGNNMKSSKERKMDRKTKHKALSVAKTEASRQRRLDNKAKRAEIHAIDPDMKVRVINQVTYNYLGTEIMVENSKIKTVSEGFDQKLQDRINEFDKGKAIDAQIEKERLFGFKALANKFRKK